MAKALEARPDGCGRFRSSPGYHPELMGEYAARQAGSRRVLVLQRFHCWESCWCSIRISDLRD